ncbi:MAG: aminopeptidase P family protein [Candidatus Omnitrophota bacterium]
MFQADVYMERRKTLMERLESDLILFLGNEESPMNYGANPYPFRQDSSFLYYFGLDDPGLAALIDADEDRICLFGDDPTVDDLVWTGPRPSLAERAQSVGVSETAPATHLAERLESARRRQRRIHYLPPYRAETISRLSRLLHVSEEEAIQGASESLILAAVAQRSIKERREIEQMETAHSVTRDMHLMAMKRSVPGAHEREIAGAMEGLARSRGCALAFPTIFTKHGETLHNPWHVNVLQAGDLVINDSAAESPEHYASDITRTIPVGGVFNSRQKAIYSIVLQTQLNAIDAIRPGVEYREIHYLACLTLARGLQDEGLLQGRTINAVEAGAHTLFFPHGVGHMLGLDAHDMENLGEDYVGYTPSIQRRSDFGWKSLRLAKALETGYVVTVEPGLYFIPALIDQWRAENRCGEFICYDRLEEYRHFGGVRIEDDVEVTDNGHRVLGTPIPKTIEEVEALASA